jgi:serine/threonine protein phosphatase 1
LTDKRRIYVIGDIHGRSDLLAKMVLAIDSDLKSSPVADGLTVTLRDYLKRHC